MFRANNLYETPKDVFKRKEDGIKCHQTKTEQKSAFLRQQTATNMFLKRTNKNNIFFTVICDLEYPFRAIRFCLGRCERGTTKTKYECNISCIYRDFVD